MQPAAAGLLAAFVLALAAVAAAAQGAADAAGSGVPATHRHLAGATVAASATNYQTTILSAASNRGLRPQRITGFGLTHYFQIPVNPIGTIFFLHGCARYARGFWPYDPVYCPECLGGW